MVLADRYGRPLMHLRISVTMACNYACIYCHREGELGSRRPDELKPHEIYLIGKAASELGIRKFKLTGGEPLLRDDIVEVVSLLNSLQPLDLALTTNGYFLSEYAYELKRAGLRRVNVSIPSLRREIYREITGVDGLEKVLEGVKAAISAGFNPVKINYVLLRGFNENEFWDFVECARNLGAILQVIELQPEGLGSKNYEKLHVNLSSFEETIKEKASKVVYRRYMHNRPQYYVDGGIVEFVRPTCNPDFCMHCTRLRITANGSIKTCLFLKPVIDLKSILMNESYDDKVKVEKIKEAIVKANELREPYYKVSTKRGE
ncbi:MAG: GTP 3',8-cyclase MoaA [Thermoprotei archaeon]|nr:MAG: GTP 3',8-cyclase MoaA [Thermoprotei archaeon]